METLENQNFQRRGNAFSPELSQASSHPGTHAQTHCVWLVVVKHLNFFPTLIPRFCCLCCKGWTRTPWATFWTPLPTLWKAASLPETWNCNCPAHLGPWYFCLLNIISRIVWRHLIVSFITSEFMTSSRKASSSCRSLRVTVSVFVVSTFNIKCWITAL